MQAAVPVGVGAMAALLGLDPHAAAEVAMEAAKDEVCDVANDNGSGQAVVSGHKTAVERAVALAQSRGAKRAIMLSVSAPFHCALMGPAAEAMRHALGQISMHPPKVPVVANVEAKALREPVVIRDALVRQVTGTVRWRESVAFMAERGVDAFYELAAGKVLTGLIKRIATGATATSVGTPDDVAAFKNSRAT
jgi:[acyl-carrier-protein] S-malonyltransferase